MPVLVDYRCGDCGDVTARWTASPPQSAATCGRCGGPARRLFGFRVGGRSGQAPAPAATPSASPCRGNPDVPLLCHVDPSAAPGWIARYRRDNRALEAHQERIETSPPPAAPAGGHSHSHGHSHHSGKTAASPVEGG